MPTCHHRRGAPARIDRARELTISRRVMPAVLAAMCSASFASPALAQDNARATAIAKATDALWQTPEQSLAVKGDQFKVKDVIVDADGGAHVRYVRTHDDIPVIGGDLVVHLEPGGALGSMTVAQKAPITDDSSPGRSAASARATAQSRFGGAGHRTDKPSLVYDATKGAPRLAHEVVVHSTDDGVPSQVHVLTDADTGAQLRAWDDVKHVEGIGRTQYSGTRPVYTTAVAGGYTLSSNDYAPAKVCMVSATACSDIVDADNDWGNGTISDPNTKAADASFGLNSTFEFLESWFGRTGVYADGTGIKIAVGLDFNGAANAGRDPEAGEATIILGNGAAGRPFTSVDIVAHEVAHSLTEDTANLDYDGESGGLNEATSDIIGTLTEAFTATATRPRNYKLGEDLSATGTPKRYMYQPSLDGASPDCWSPSVAEMEVHQSSGLGNKFFFMLAEGSSGSSYGTAPTCGAPAVSGIGPYSAGRIWYTALTTYMTTTTQYKAVGSNDARAATLSAATDLYGYCSAKYRAVQASWTATGVSGEDAACLPPTIGTTGANQQGDTAVNLITNINNYGMGGTTKIEYGTTTALGSTMTETIPVVSQYVFAFELTGLTPGTVYYYKVTNTTAAGTAVTATKTFVTSALPQITAGSTFAVSPTIQTVNWSGNTFGRSGTLKVDYGTTTSFGSSVTRSITVNGTGGFSGMSNLSGLTEGTVYYYKITLTTSRGTASTTTKTFVTSAPPQITAGTTSAASPTSQNVMWSGKTFGLAGTLKVDYGTTTSYGSTATRSISASGAVSFSGMSVLTGLTTGQTYHYRVTLTTSRGTAVTTNRTFVAGA